ncbi:MAG: 30S ribosomal protein S6 [Nitrospiraceae bacterium]|nr:30S ribosomal protein S6 [Nitrospiraceae bacterium]
MKLRYYETFYLLHPDLSEEDRAAISERLEQIVTEKGGQVVKVNPWPLHKLAYKVQKQTQGYYVAMEYGASPDAILDLTTSMRLDDSILKFITVKKADKFDVNLKKDVASPAESADEEATDSVQHPDTIGEE